jgi:hypothetical protein|tara:strand:- start:236 stop:415 length:180 start_codon:yes stop_codon:yes gene_type:complete
MDFLMENYLIISGAILTIIWLIVSATSTKKDDKIFWLVYDRLKEIMPMLPKLRKKDEKK